MSRVQFEAQPPSRPSPIRLGSSTKTSPEIVKTPYPRKIYDLASDSPAPGLQSEIHTYLRNSWPADSLHVTCTDSLFAVTSQWELRKPNSIFHDPDYAGCTNFVHAHHIRVEFPSTNKPEDDKCEVMAECIRTQILSKHNMPNAVVGFGFFGGTDIIFECCLPKLDKTKLKAFFEDNESQDLDSDRKAEDTEDHEDSLPVPHTEGETNIIRNEMAPLSLEN